MDTFLRINASVGSVHVLLQALSFQIINVLLKQPRVQRLSLLTCWSLHTCCHSLLNQLFLEKQEVLAEADTSQVLLIMPHLSGAPSEPFFQATHMRKTHGEGGIPADGKGQFKGELLFIRSACKVARAFE